MLARSNEISEKGVLKWWRLTHATIPFSFSARLLSLIVIARFPPPTSPFTRFLTEKISDQHQPPHRTFFGLHTLFQIKSNLEQVGRVKKKEKGDVYTYG
jgi:hypothetical protein